MYFPRGQLRYHVPMDESRRSATPVVVAVLVTILLPVVYLLSIGPAVWLIQHEYLARETARAIYYPLVFAAEHNSWFNAALQWYSEWFA
jgi:hypothetical protein